ncbi:MAG: hypothetical protein ABEK50_07550 [bacterium]
MKWFNKLTVATAVVAVAFRYFLSPVQAQPITFPGSMSIGEKDYMVRVQSWYEQSTDDPSGQGRELVDWNTRLFGLYGLSEKTALFSRIA